MSLFKPAFGGAGTGGILTVDDNHIFSAADIGTAETARDAYFASNPSELLENIYCVLDVTNIDSPILQEYRNDVWVGVSALIKGEQGEGNQDSIDVLHGMFDKTVTGVVSVNTNPSLIDIAPFEYYINGVKYSYGGVTGLDPLLSASGDFRLIGVDSSGVFLHTLNEFFIPSDLENSLEVGGFATTDGSTIAVIGNSHFNADEFFRNIHRWGKFAKGTDFLNGAARITEHSTPLQLSIGGGDIIDPNMNLETIAADSGIGLVTNYHVAGTWTLTSEVAPYTLDVVRYDNGTDLVDMTDGYFATHTVGRSSRTGTVYLFYSQAQYPTFIDAINAQPQKGEFGEAQGTEVEYVAQIVIGKNETSINRILDIRGYSKDYPPFQSATETSYDNTVSGIPSDNTKGAIDHLQANKADISLLSSNITLYPTTTVGDFGYARMVTSPIDPDYDTVAVDVSTGAITGDNQLISTLIADAGLFEGSIGYLNIPTIGNIRKTAGGFSNSGTFYFEAYKRDIGGTETLLGTSNTTSTVSSDTYEQFSASALLENPTFLASDRLVVKYYGSNTGGSSPVFDFQFGGSQPVRTELPVPVNVTPSATAAGTSLDSSSMTIDVDNVQQGMEELEDLLESNIAYPTTSISTPQSINPMNVTTFVDATAGDLTVTIPTAVGKTGITINVIRIDNSGYDLTLVTTGGETISLEEGIILNPADSVILVSDGTNWWIK